MYVEQTVFSSHHLAMIILFGKCRHGNVNSPPLIPPPPPTKGHCVYRLGPTGGGVPWSSHSYMPNIAK